MRPDRYPHDPRHGSQWCNLLYPPWRYIWYPGLWILAIWTNFHRLFLAWLLKIKQPSSSKLTCGTVSEVAKTRCFKYHDLRLSEILRFSTCARSPGWVMIQTCFWASMIESVHYTRKYDSSFANFERQWLARKFHLETSSASRRPAIMSARKVESTNFKAERLK